MLYELLVMSLFTFPIIKYLFLNLQKTMHLYFKNECQRKQIYISKFSFKLSPY